MLTVFGIPKPFTDHLIPIQTNAVSSWARLGPSCEVLLLGNEPGTAELAAKLRIRHLGDVERNAHGTPLLSSILSRAEATARHAILCYVNADIILLPGVLESAQRVWTKIGPSLIIGRRWDVELRDCWNFDTDDSAQRLAAFVRARGRPHNRHAMDYFVFPRGLWPDVPPFGIGRTFWDNWLVSQALAQQVPVVDASAVILAIHQNHDYGHVAGGTHGAWHGAEAQENLALLGGLDRIADLRDVTWVMTPTTLRPARGVGHRVRRWSREHRVGGPLQHAKRALQAFGRRWQMARPS